MCAENEQYANEKPKFELRIPLLPSDDSFILQAIYPTCPGFKAVVDLSSGCIMPRSVISYFLRV